MSKNKSPKKTPTPSKFEEFAILFEQWVEETDTDEKMRYYTNIFLDHYEKPAINNSLDWATAYLFVGFIGACDFLTKIKLK